MEHNEQSDELLACTPTTVDTACFNNQAILPYNLTVEHIHLAMDSFTAFLGYMNKELYTRRLKRLESMFMQANFSSLVGEYMKSTIPTFCTNIVTNRHHNGHPDLIPIDYYPNNDVEHGSQGIEIKGSRYTGNWQGHNAEDCWLMVFVYDSNRPENAEKGIYLPKALKFLMVVGAHVTEEDWAFSGRNPGSRRTITASIRKSGRDKMLAN